MNETAIAAFGTVAVAIIGAVAGAYLKVAVDRRKGQAEERGSTIKEFELVVDLHERNNERLRQENKELREEVTETREEMKAMRARKELLIAKAADCYQKFSAAQECIVHYEEKLAENKIPFKPWTPRTGGDSVAEMEARP